MSLLARTLLVTVLCAGSVSAAPSRVLHGVVTGDGGAPIAGAVVTDASGGAAITGAHGSFALAVMAGDRDLAVEAAGYASRTVPVTAGPLRIQLVPSGRELIEVTGKAPAPAEPVSYTLSRGELQLIAGTDDDILRAAQALPGVARIPYSFGGLVLRGTSPSDTAVYLDGIEVPIAFHFGGITSFYPSDMLADLTVTPGGFDASYGRAEGGIVTLTTREPRTDRWRVGGSLDLLSASAQAEGPVAGGGLIVGIRRSYLDTVVGPFADPGIPLPSYWDAQLRGSFGDPARHGRFTPLLFLSIDHMADHITPSLETPDHVALTSMFVRAAVPYLRRWGALSLRVVPWIGMNRLSYEHDHDSDRTSFVRPVYPAGLRADLTREVGWGELRAGLDAEGGHLSTSQVSPDGFGANLPNGRETETWLDLGLWSDARIEAVRDRLSLRPGIRVDHYGLTHESVVDPRLNLDLRLTDAVTLHQAIGRFHQPPTPADVEPLDGNPALRSSYYDQVSLGVDAALPHATTLSITGYYDWGHDLGVPVSEYDLSSSALAPILQLLLEKQLGLPTIRNNAGRGRSYGVELLLKHHVGRWFGMIGYTLAKSEVTYAAAPDDWHRFELDQRHHLELAGSVALARWTLGARVELVSGNPYSPTTCVRTQDGSLSCWDDYLEGTLPPFFQLDLRADHVWHRRCGDIHFYLDIQNATDRANVEARDLVEPVETIPPAERDVTGLPILPFIGVKFVPR